MSDEDDGSLLLWLALGAAVIYFLSKKFSPAAIAAPVPAALPAPAASSAVVAAQPTPDLTAAATNATAPPFAEDTDFGIESTTEW